MSQLQNITEKINLIIIFFPVNILKPVLLAWAPHILYTGYQNSAVANSESFWSQKRKIKKKAVALGNTEPVF